MGSGRTVRDVADEFETSKSTMQRIRDVATGRIDPRPKIQDTHIKQFKRHLVAWAFLSSPYASALAISQAAAQLGSPGGVYLFNNSGAASTGGLTSSRGRERLSMNDRGKIH